MRNCKGERNCKGMVLGTTLGLMIILIFSLFLQKCQAADFDRYQYVELTELSSNSDKYNSEEVQIIGTINHIDEYIGPYGGEYYGLAVSDTITVLVYKSEAGLPYIGDKILVEGVFYIYSKFGGGGYNNFISTKHYSKIK